MPATVTSGEKMRLSKTAAWALTALLLAAGCDDGAPAAQGERPAKSPSPAASREAPRHQVGETARSGPLDITVRGFECGKQELVQRPYRWKAKKGQYCVFEVHVANTSTAPATFVLMGQTAVGADDVRYRSKAVVPYEPRLQDDLDGREESTGPIFFDIPTEQRLVRLELREYHSPPVVFDLR